MSEPVQTGTRSIDGMSVLDVPAEQIDESIKRSVTPTRRTDPLIADWSELATPDGWGVPYVYDFGAYKLVARELLRWADRAGGEAGDQMRRRAAWLLADKTAGVSRGEGTHD